MDKPLVIRVRLHVKFRAFFITFQEREWKYDFEVTRVPAFMWLDHGAHKLVDWRGVTLFAGVLDGDAAQ